MSRIRSIALGAVVAIVALGAGLLLSRALLAPTTQPNVLATGTLLTPARPLPSMAFTDQDGAKFDDARLQGRWSLMFFGFTSCPDVCPATLTLLAQVEKQLADLPAERRPQIVLVSVDPQRDTPEQLAKYVRFFSPTFIGIRAEEPQIDEFTRNLGVPVARTPTGDGGYTVDHSGSIFAIDPSGRMRALFSPPHDAAALAADLRRLTQARADG
jgi:protein SCO1/2